VEGGDAPQDRSPRLAALRLRDLRTYEEADLELGPGLTVVSGPNGAGKTNLLEAAYVACTGRSFRAAGDRELVRRGRDAAHVAVEVERPGFGRATFTVGLVPGDRRRLRVDGAPVDGLLDHPSRPLLSVFLPDRLALVKGTPGLRRAHLDQVVLALRPAAAAVRRRYVDALRQRNALLGQLRAREVSPAAAATDLEPWDRALADAAVALTGARAEAVALLADPVAARAEELGLAGELSVEYRPRVAGDAEAFRAALAERRAGDLERGFTHAGPHRDELALRRDGRAIARFGSQGEQRLCLLALLLGEADALQAETGRRPVLLLDDVMSELDATRRERLVAVLRAGGQALVTVTEAAHVPHADDPGVGRVEVEPGHARALRVSTIAEVA
jgi:DNA replication and repair protein RecF